MKYQVTKAITYKPNHPTFNGSHVYLTFDNGVKAHLFTNCDASGINLNESGVFLKDTLYSFDHYKISENGEIPATSEEIQVGNFCRENFKTLMALAK